MAFENGPYWVSEGVLEGYRRLEIGRESRTEVAAITRMRTFFSLETPRRTGRSLSWEIT